MLNKSCEDLKSIQSSCQSLVRGDPLDALTGCQKVQEEVQQARVQVDSLSLKPLIRAKMKVKVSEEDLRNKSLHSICDNLHISFKTDGKDRKRGCGQEGQSQEAAAAVGSNEQAAASADIAEDGENGSSDFNEISTSDEMDSLSNMMFKVDPSSVSRDDETVGRSHEGRGDNSEDARRSSFLETVLSRYGVNESESESVYRFPLVGSTESSNPFQVHMQQAMNRTPSGDSDSLLSDADVAPPYSMPLSRNMDSARMLREAPSIPHGALQMISHSIPIDDLCSDDEEGGGRHLSRRLFHGMRQSSPSAGYMGTLDALEPLEIRRHWEFLNDHLEASEAEHVGGASVKDEEEDEEEEDVALASKLMNIPSFLAIVEK